METEKIYYNGTILTMENMEKENGVKAISTTKNTICGIYDTLETGFREHPEAEKIDLHGQTLLPAFLDSHSHITAFANTLSLLSLEKANSFDDIIQLLRQSENEEDWIIGFGYDHNALKERRQPDKTVLDAVSTTKPVLISNISGHMGAVNSKALEVLKKDSNHSGYFEETDFIDLTACLPAPSLKQLSKNMEKAQDIYLKNGITTIQEGMVKKDSFALLDDMAKSHKLKVDVVGYADLRESGSLVDENLHYRNRYQNHFKLGGYKIFLDGSPQGKTAWMSQPYENEPNGYAGYPIYTDEEVESFIRIATNAHMQLLVHCNGDQAAEQFLNAAYRVPAIRQIRPVMVHAQTVRKDQIERMNGVAMIPSYFVSHIQYWGDVHLKNLGNRAYSISPVRTTIACGVPYTFHQDTPVLPPNMLDTLRWAVERQTKSGILLGGDERITPYEALKGVTIHAAYQYFEENTKGSLAVGKRADFVILDHNPLHTPFSEIHVMQTIAQGKIQYTL